jgi:exonuclease VII small subunit
MNNAQRKRLDAALKALNDAAPLIDEAKEIIEEVRGEEEEKFESLSEGLRQSERGQLIEQAMSALQEAVDALDCCDPNEVIALVESAME